MIVAVSVGGVYVRPVVSAVAAIDIDVYMQARQLHAHQSYAGQGENGHANSVHCRTIHEGNRTTNTGRQMLEPLFWVDFAGRLNAQVM